MGKQLMHENNVVSSRKLLLKGVISKKSEVSGHMRSYMQLVSNGTELGLEYWIWSVMT